MGLFKKPTQQPGELARVVGEGPAGVGGTHDLGGKGPLRGNDRLPASEVLIELDRGGELPIRIRLDEQDTGVRALVEGGQLLPGTVNDVDPAAGRLEPPAGTCSAALCCGADPPSHGCAWTGLRSR